VTTGHSGCFFFQADLILFIRNNEAGYLIEIALGLHDFDLGTLNHFEGGEEFVVFNFDSCIVDFHGQDIQAFGDVIVDVLLELEPGKAVWDTDLVLGVVDCVDD